MASQTPNLNLVLPDGNEKVSRTTINSNNTIIDTAVGNLSNLPTTNKNSLVESVTELNSKLINLENIGTVSTLAGLETLLETVCSSMVNGEHRYVMATQSAKFEPFNYATATIFFELYRHSAANTVINARPAGTVTIICCTRQNGAYTWHDINNITDLENAPANGSKTYTLPSNRVLWLTTTGTAATRMSVWWVFSRSNGSVVLLEVAKGSGVTVTAGSNNQITITNSTGGECGVQMMTIS